MTLSNTDAFSVPEMYLLAAAFGGNVLFGLPEKEIYQLKGEEVFEEAHKRLIEKEILTPDGKITDGGAIIIQAIEYYHQSKKYVRINNLMFAFINEEKDEIIMLVEVEEKSLYKLLVMSKALVLKMLGEHFPVILREPGKQEKNFLKEKLSNRERHETEQYDPGKTLMNLELFYLDDALPARSNPAYYQQWLIFEKDGKLIMVDTMQKAYYHASQYWFLKVLFDEMEFPYKEAQ